MVPHGERTKFELRKADDRSSSSTNSCEPLNLNLFQFYCFRFVEKGDSISYRLITWGVPQTLKSRFPPKQKPVFDLSPFSKPFNRVHG